MTLRRNRAGLGTAVAIRVAVAVAYLSSGAHYLLVDHAPCIEHGDVGHVAGTVDHGHAHADVHGGGAGDRAERQAAVHTAPAGPSEHGHCDTTAARTAVATPVATWVAPVEDRADRTSSEWPAIDGAPSRLVIGYAPKRAPPVSLG